MRPVINRSPSIVPQVGLALIETNQLAVELPGYVSSDGGAGCGVIVRVRISPRIETLVR